jgi:ancient ubiquitous protein 1
MGEQVRLEQLFHSSWFRPAGLSTLALILYAPIGVCLLIVRLFIALQFFILALILPPNKFRQKVLRIICGVLGLTISTEGDSHPHGKVFVSNHITSFDHLAIHLATNAFAPTKKKIFKFLMKPLALFLTDNESVTNEQIEFFDDPVIVFPEGKPTNGEVGMLAFTTVTIPEGFTIQPVGLQVSRPFFHANCITASLTEEIIIGLFLPNTHFSIKFLPVDTVDAEGEWKKRAQATIAQSLNLAPTKFTTADRAEWLKRILFRPPSVATMARAVQQQLSPQILATETILAALQRTGTVDGAVQYLRQTCAASLASGSGLPATFPKSAAQRMMSFQERKRIMIATARQKYIETHGLNIST